MSIEKTVFGKHYKHEYCKATTFTFSDGSEFKLTAPKNGYIIRDTVHELVKGSKMLRYMYVQQLNNCDACIVTTSCVSSHGHFNATMRLISYNTLVVEAAMHNYKVPNDAPYVTFVIGEHWNHSRTTVQHVYKFLKMFGFTNVSVSKLYQYDKRYNSTTWAAYPIANNVGKIGEIMFTSERAILDFQLNDASRFVDRMIEHHR